MPRLRWQADADANAAKNILAAGLAVTGRGGHGAGRSRSASHPRARRALRGAHSERQGRANVPCHGKLRLQMWVEVNG